MSRIPLLQGGALGSFQRACYVNSSDPNVAYADLGQAWFRYQTARLRQRHLQFGQHLRLDVEALLARLAGVTRAARRIKTPTAPVRVEIDHLRRAMIEAIEYCALLDAASDLPSSPPERLLQSAWEPNCCSEPGIANC